MTLTKPINTYYYHYKSEPGINRRIQFFQSDDKIVTVVSRLINQQWSEMQTLSEDVIECDAETSADALKRFEDAVAHGVETTFPPNKRFSALNLSDKKGIIAELGEDKTYGLDVYSLPTKDFKSEKVDQIVFRYLE